MKTYLLIFGLLASAICSFGQDNFSQDLKAFIPMNNDFFNACNNQNEYSLIEPQFHPQFYNASWGFDSNNIVNGAGYFDGASRVNVWDKILGSNTDEFSIEFWFRSSSATTQVFYWEGVNNDFRIYIRMEPTDNRIRANIGNLNNNGDTHEVSTTATFNDGFWHHYALTMAPGGISKVYVDGVLNASNTDAYAVGSTTNFTRLGCNDNIAQFLDGNMDNLKVWNRVLGAGEVASIYNQPVIHINTAAITDCANAPVGVDFSLLGGSGSFQSGNEFYIQISNAAGSFRYPKLIGSLTGNSSGTINFNIPPDLASGTYKLRIISTEFPAISENTIDLTVTNANVNSGFDFYSDLIFHLKLDSNAVDSTGNSSNGSFTGSPTGTTDRFNTPNSAMDFDGSDRVSLGKPHPLWRHAGTTDPLTFSFWLFQDMTPADYGYVFSSWTPGSNNGLWIGTTNTGKLRFRANGSNYIEAPISNNQWNHYTCVYTGSAIRIYRNGVFVVSTNTGAMAMISSFEMGRNTQSGAPAQQYYGKIDEFMIFDRAFTAAEAMAIYQGSVIYNNGPLCDGDLGQLYAPNTPGLTYDWTGPDNFVSAIEDPQINPFTTFNNAGDYDVVMTLSGCVGETLTTTIGSTVPSAAGVTGDTVCFNEMVTLSASGAASQDEYQWFSDPNGLNLVADSTATYTFTGTVTDTFYVNITPNGICQSALTPVYAVVYPSPSVSATASATIVCEGDNITLSGSGAQTYSWDNGVVDGVSFSAMSTTTYTVTGTDGNGCENSDMITVTVNALPTVNAGLDIAICNSSSVTITATGATTYNWDQGLGAGATHNITPSSTTTYMVTGTDVNGCQNTDAVTITVNQLPNVSAGADASICEGNAAVISATGAANYNWDQGLGSGSTHNISPATTTTYTVTGTDANGCQNTDMVTITVNTLPTVDAGPDQTVCEGNTVTLNGSGANSYVWDNGVINGSPFSPSTTNTYNVIGTDINGCENSDIVTVTVNPTPVTSAITGDTLIMCNSVSEIYSVVNTAGSVYSWTVPSGASIVSGQSTNQIEVDFMGNFGVVSVVEESVDGCSGNAVEIIVTCNLGLENTSQNDIRIYPVPVADHFNLSGLKDGENYELKIYDKEGRLVLNTKIQKHDQIDVSTLAPGVYTCWLSFENKSSVLRFVK